MLQKKIQAKLSNRCKNIFFEDNLNKIGTFLYKLVFYNLNLISIFFCLSLHYLTQCYLCEFDMINFLFGYGSL